MKKSIPLSLLVAAFAVTSAQAQLFNQNITAIFGGGNPDTGWTVSTDSDSGIIVAMRAKNREDASTTNVDGVYSEPTGYQQPNGNRARWNWEFSINSGTVNLDQYDYYVGIDTDTSVGVSQLVVDALTTWTDSSYGNNSTANGAGVEGTSATYASVYNIVQQSQNIRFQPVVHDPTLPGTYDYELFAVAKGAGPTAEKLVTVGITVITGDGGATVQQLVDQLAVGVVNHGDYVTSVNQLTKYLLEGDVINKKQQREILTTAAKSSIGK